MDFELNSYKMCNFTIDLRRNHENLNIFWQMGSIGKFCKGQNRYLFELHVTFIEMWYIIWTDCIIWSRYKAFIKFMAGMISFHFCFCLIRLSITRTHTHSAFMFILFQYFFPSISLNLTCEYPFSFYMLADPGWWLAVRVLLSLFRFILGNVFEMEFWNCRKLIHSWQLNSPLVHYGINCVTFLKPKGFLCLLYKPC